MHPAGPLELATQYTATVSGVKDTAGNQMVAPTSWNFTTPTCPCSFWNGTATPVEQSHADPTAVEVGMHFKPEVPGFVTGIGFFKGPINSGTHIGHLWSGTGTQLANVTFANETAIGWQRAAFASPVAVSANTDYVISYHTDAGNYAITSAYFNTSATDVGPLLAPANAQGAPNGLFRYSASPGVFPTNTFGATNYWVDVTFAPSVGAGGPQISAIQAAAIDQNNEHITWTTDKQADSLVVYGTTASYGQSTLLNTTPVSSHMMQLTGLTPNTPYHFQVKGCDSAGNLAFSADQTFTSAPVPRTTPPVISRAHGQSTRVGWKLEVQ